MSKIHTKIHWNFLISLLFLSQFFSITYNALHTALAPDFRWIKSLGFDIDLLDRAAGPPNSRDILKLFNKLSKETRCVEASKCMAALYPSILRFQPASKWTEEPPPSKTIKPKLAALSAPEVLPILASNILWEHSAFKKVKAILVSDLKGLITMSNPCKPNLTYNLGSLDWNSGSLRMELSPRRFMKPPVPSRASSESRINSWYAQLYTI